MRNLVLGDSLEALIDHRGKTPKKLGTDFTVNGVPVASAILVVNGILNLSDARLVSVNTYRKWMPIPTRQGDVLLTSEAPLGRVARVPSNEPLVLGQRLYGLRGKKGVLDNNYLYYALQTKRVQADLMRRSTGTTVFGIRQSALRCIHIPAPSFAEQRAIATVLGALDDKIAANRKVATTSRALAATMFSRLQAHEARETNVGSWMTLEYGKALPAALRVLGPVDVFGSGGVVGSHGEPLVDGPGVVVGRKGTVGAVYWAARDFYPIDTTFYVRPKTKTIPLIFCYFVLRSLGLGDHNSDSAVPGLNRNHAYAAKFQLPELEDTMAFGADATSLFEFAFQADQESESLGAMRDALLSALMSGKLRVKVAEKTVEEVLSSDGN